MTTGKGKSDLPARRRGRPDGLAGLSFSARTGAAIAARMRKGNYLTTACAAEGVPIRTVYDWLRRAAADKKAGLDTPLARFSRALDRAEAEAEAMFAERVHDIAAQGGDLSTALRAAETLLKKRFRSHWGDAVAKLGPDDVRDLDDEHLAHLVRDTFGAEPLAPGEVPDDDEQGDGNADHD